MKKKYLLLALTALVLFGVYFLSNKPGGESVKGQSVVKSECEFDQLVYYYLDQCQWCQKVKNEETLSKLEKLGVKIKKVNANVGPVRHRFEGVPTFVINEEVTSGYQTFERLKEKLGCKNDG